MSLDTRISDTRNIEAGLDSLFGVARNPNFQCQYGKYSIWHLWPNRANEAASNGQFLNYYGIFDTTNRLYKISQLGNVPGTSKPARIQYFENMSRAMANNVELTALRNHVVELASSLVVINASDPNFGAWRVNCRTLQVQGPGQVARRDEWEPYDMAADIKFGPHRRENLCLDSGVGEEPDGMDGMDFFG
ncbi:hypothetical protein QBC33DRAFT_563608 [Phialemonium atrogriseum]|uniref:Uncharacterized protein n=1 Tax=Phialemonium atrogriseum TaxID=1093897 RepID=A0AAJ0BT47_9PEZI|nr:uncharacterized protein QBC33DRAFT_563608 [Phialemonium atrogriseum]KAK1762619.1 hypothetical protein QBC33DRAFT_563608 [Phialemonium atrogriseum]